MHANRFLISNTCWVNADGCTDHEPLGVVFCLQALVEQHSCLQALEEQHDCLHLPGLSINCVATA